MLNIAIDALNLAKDVSVIAPAQAAFASVNALLTLIRDSIANDQDHVELGLNCADICKALDRGMKGKKTEDLSQSVHEAITQLTTTVAEVQNDIRKQSERNRVSRLLHARNDKDKIAAWKSELDRILNIFNTELAINTHVTVSDIRNDVSKIWEEVGGRVRSMQTRTGELPPSPPRACFGRDDLIERIVDLAEKLTPTALIGAGGIGKTSVALAALHHDRIKARFGEDRRFIRCDQFPASRAHFLNLLSKAIGAGVENPEDLNSLRSALSSKEIFIILDNSESIIDPRGPHGQEIYNIVEELSQFSNICLCITSRITAIPPDFEALEIPTLSMEAARHAFYRIYKHGEHSGPIDDILRQLDFHPLSITLLATVAHQNRWDYNRLSKEWQERRVGVLQTEHNRSLAATIELSLASPTFVKLGPDARALLEVVAFFPQGVNEDNLGWLFPTTLKGTPILDKLCALSLTYRNNESVTMLAPLRDHLRPTDPKSCPLLRVIKDRYFKRLSAFSTPARPGFEKSRWIISEDANVEHLLNVLTTIDADSDDVWSACAQFMRLLYWHKPRHTVLRRKVEGLPDDHRSKPDCLFELALLSGSVGNYAEKKRLLNHTLRLQRERGNHKRVALTLTMLSDANRALGLYKEGINQTKEALEIYERSGNTLSQARCLNHLSRLLCSDGQLDAAEDAANRTIELLPEKRQEFQACRAHLVLGNIYCSKGEREKAIHHFEMTLEIASRFNWHHPLFWTHFSLAEMFLDESEFGDAHSHIGQAKLHAVDAVYHMGRAALLQARIFYRQGRLEDATSETSRALEIFEDLGVPKDLEDCRALLRDVGQAR